MTTEERDSQAALASALLSWQEDHLNTDLLIAADISAYGLALSFSVTEAGQFQATLLHIDGGRLDSGFCSSPEQARDLLLGVRWMKP